MTDYISRQAVIGMLEDIDDMNRVERIPTADVVPKSLYKQTQWERDFAEKRADDMSKLIRNKDVVAVVRCKDCKYNESGACANSGFLLVGPNDYCSYAERINEV